MHEQLFHSRGRVRQENVRWKQGILSVEGGGHSASGALSSTSKYM